MAAGAISRGGIFIKKNHHLTSFVERLAFVHEFEDGIPVDVLAKKYDVAEKLIRLYVYRYNHFGIAGLKHGTSVPLPDNLLISRETRLRIAKRCVVRIPKELISERVIKMHFRDAFRFVRSHRKLVAREFNIGRDTVAKISDLYGFFHVLSIDDLNYAGINETGDFRDYPPGELLYIARIAARGTVPVPFIAAAYRMNPDSLFVLKRMYLKHGKHAKVFQDAPVKVYPIRSLTRREVLSLIREIVTFERPLTRLAEKYRLDVRQVRRIRKLCETEGLDAALTAYTRNRIDCRPTTAEERIEIAQEVVEKHRAFKEVAKSYRVPEPRVRYWVRLYQSGGEDPLRSYRQRVYQDTMDSEMSEEFDDED